MWTAVVPAYNEAPSISRVVKSLIESDIRHIILVANGCTDNTCELARQASTDIVLEILEFPQPLGFDVPRAVGAAYAKRHNPRGIVFIDGDMKGDISSVIVSLKAGIERGLDLALCNCYPVGLQHFELASRVLKEREDFNRTIGLSGELGSATPSHGPHAVSSRFLTLVKPIYLAIPPLALAEAVTCRLAVGVSASIPHDLLGSQNRSDEHGILIAETIIGDCRQALSYLQGQSSGLFLQEGEPNAGYRPLRRFDLLEAYLEKLES